MKRDINDYLDKVLVVIGVVFGAALLAGGVLAFIGIGGIITRVCDYGCDAELMLVNFLIICFLGLFGWGIMKRNLEKMERSPVVFEAGQERLSAKGENLRKGNHTKGQVIKRCIYYLNQVWAVVGIIVGVVLLVWGWFSVIEKSKYLVARWEVWYPLSLAELLLVWYGFLLGTCVTIWMVVVSVKSFLDKDNSVTLLSRAMKATMAVMGNPPME